MWEFVKQRLQAGSKAYIVCPLVEESERLEAASATQTFAELSSRELSGFDLRLLHGQLASAEKAAAMAAFVRGEAQVLVSTSVIEVGVDVTAAEVMVIMGARRFGLSQLHQLRGRVGRGQEQSYCFLMVEGEEGEALERLALFARTSDGFQLAEADLRYRGEGQIFGERQSGIGDLEVASLLRDRRLLEDARSLAREVVTKVATGQESCVYETLLAASATRFGDKISWMDRA
jgi:ATP-dependent DNA helicase RecG